MKKLIYLLASITAATLTYSASADPQLGAHNFTDAGNFRLTVSGNSDIEVSHDLQTWSKLASITQPAAIEDLASRSADRRFYREHGSSNIIGYLKVVIPPGKFAILGNSFATAIRLYSPESRHLVFGMTNPPVKVSLYTNGNFVAHSLDTSSGTWTPQLRIIRPQEGFAVHNLGTVPLTVRLSGSVRQGRVHTMIPAGQSLLASPFPTSLTSELRDIPLVDGTQLNWFDEQTQSYQTSTFDTLEKPGKWGPKLPTVLPGRAVVLKAPQPITLTNSFPSTPAR